MTALSQVLAVLAIGLAVQGFMLLFLLVVAFMLVIELHLRFKINSAS